MRDLIVVLLQFLLCTVMVEAADEWQVSPYVRYAALGALLLCAYLLLGDRIVACFRFLERLSVRFREWGMGLPQRVKLALMLHLSVRPVGWELGPEVFPQTTPARAEQGLESEDETFEYRGYKIPFLSSEPADEALRFDEIDAGALSVKLCRPDAVSGAGQSQYLRVDAGFPLVGKETGVVAKLPYLPFESQQPLDDLRFTESLGHRAGS